MHNFFLQCYANYKGLFLWLNWPGYISSVVLQPFSHVLMFAMLGRFAQSMDAAQAYALGISVYSMAFVTMNGIAQSYSYDRLFGTISFVYVSITSRLVNFLSRSVLHYPNAFFAFGCGLMAAWTILDLDFSNVNWLAIIATTLILAASISAAGQLLGILSIAFRDWIAFQAMTLGILLLFTGIIIPSQSLPGPIAGFAKLLPITNGLIGIKMAFAGEPFARVAGSIVREAIICFTYYAISFMGFLLFEIMIKRSGTLEKDGL